MFQIALPHGAAQGEDESGLDAEQRLFVADLTREFEWDGVHLTGGQKAAAGQTKARLLQFESLFMQTVAQQGVALTHADDAAEEDTETEVKLGVRTFMYVLYVCTVYIVCMYCIHCMYCMYVLYICIVSMYVLYVGEPNLSPDLMCRAVRVRLGHFQISAAVADELPPWGWGNPAQ